MAGDPVGVIAAIDAVRRCPSIVFILTDPNIDTPGGSFVAWGNPPSFRWAPTFRPGPVFGDVEPVTNRVPVQAPWKVTSAVLSQVLGVRDVGGGVPSVEVVRDTT